MAGGNQMSVPIIASILLTAHKLYGKYFKEDIASLKC